jgi:hypothetical protein
MRLFASYRQAQTAREIGSKQGFPPASMFFLMKYGKGFKRLGID